MSDQITELDIDQIQKRIPHRPPMLLIERVEEIVPDHSAVGVKMVSVSEPYFAGHFPDYPIMPGVLIVEAMAQTAACMVSVTLGGDTDDKLVFFTTIDKVKFRKPVLPGDQVRFEMRKIRNRTNIWKFEGIATVDGVKVAEAEISAMLVDGASGGNS